MLYRICPKCTSWKLKAAETASRRDRVLKLFNLRFYYCKDCGWYGIARSKNKQNLVKVLRQPYIWKNILNGFLVLAGVFAISILFISLIGKFVPQVQTDTPSEVTKMVSGSTAQSVSESRPSDKMVTSTVNTAANTKSSEQPLADSIQIKKVIGNRDSKLYHLQGMKYYHLIDTHHRIEFSSEDEAIKAGYHKAPR